MLIVNSVTTHGVARLASGLVVGKGHVIRCSSLANHGPMMRVDDALTHMEGIMCFCISWRKANLRFELRA